MQFDLRKSPYFFAAGFSVQPDSNSVTMEDAALLNRFIEDLFNMRFMKVFKLFDAPVFDAKKNCLTFSCTLKTPIFSDHLPFLVSIDADFRFSCEDVAVNNFSLECESIKNLAIHNLQSAAETKVTPYEQWAKYKFNDRIGTMYDDLAKMMNANSHYMKHYFNNDGLDLFREVEDHLERIRRLECAYSKVTVRIGNNDFETEKDYLVRSIDTKNIKSPDFLIKTYEEIGSDVGLNTPVKTIRNGFSTDVEGYESVNLKTHPDEVHHADFFMSNRDETGFLKIKEIEPITLQEIEAGRKFLPKILDLDTGNEVSI